jgi:hypothetical protein
MEMMREMVRETKKRKKVSDAERLALELSKIACDLYKITPDNSQHNNVRFVGNKARFSVSRWLNCNAPSCNLNQIGQQTCYCANAEFR